jgi:hypothetical protein
MSRVAHVPFAPFGSSFSKALGEDASNEASRIHVGNDLALQPASSLDHLVCLEEDPCGVVRVSVLAMLRLMISGNCMGYGAYHARS